MITKLKHRTPIRKLVVRRPFDERSFAVGSLAGVILTILALAALALFVGCSYMPAAFDGTLAERHALPATERSLDYKQEARRRATDKLFVNVERPKNE